MGVFLVHSRQKGRCPGLLDAGAGALLTHFEEGYAPEGGKFCVGGFGKWVHGLWRWELGCVGARVMKASVCPRGTLLCSQHGWKAPPGSAHLY